MRSASSKTIERNIVEINRFNETPGHGVTRDVFTKEDFLARDYVKREMKAAGLEVSEDCIGNIYGVLEGTDPSLAPVWTGSHIDTVRNGGMYDGMAGVFAGLEALRIIRESGQTVKRSLSVNVYTGEEMGRFGVCCVGSRALAGRYGVADLKTYRDREGKSLYRALQEAGYDLLQFRSMVKKQGDVYASLELHIEQNDILEKEDIPFGIVTGICAPTNLIVEVEGVQGHAGGVSMTQRKDAYMAAAEISLQLEKLVRQSKGSYMTGTVGSMKLEPDAVNVIPGKAVFSIDIRGISMKGKEQVLVQFRDCVKQIKEKRGVIVRMEMQNHDQPVVCDERLRQVLRDSCEGSGHACMDLISGAYHDSLMLADFTRVAMLFIPCRGGVSHSEQEWASCEHIAWGADVLAESLLCLGNEV